MNNSLQRRFSMTLAVVLVLAALAQAQTFTTLYNFTGYSDGAYPNGGVVRDEAGKVYGTTAYGGNLHCNGGYGCGVVFKLGTAGTETVLHSFSGRDGEFPSPPAARDDKGNIYGTTVYGGPGRCIVGCGVVFKIDTAGNERALYNLTGGSEGCLPYQGLARGKAGELYGTTVECGSYGYGTIFKLDGAGNFSVLHSFAGGSSDGSYPYLGHLTMDKSGNLYGVTTQGGGTGCYAGYGCGALYKLTTKGKFTILYSFAGGTTDGCYPYGSVTMDKAGNFYGTTSQCGSKNYGIVWEVSQKGKETILHNFVGYPSDGCNPQAGVARDSTGSLYGVTYSCGANNYGALYKLSAGGKLALLHSFDGSDGASPLGEVLRTGKGTLFGTTDAGGIDGAGTVWSCVP